MSNQKQLYAVIKQFTGQASILTIPRIFIDITGDLKSALFLNQCIYWSDKGGRPDGYFYKTVDSWKEETGLSKFEIASARKQLETAGFIECKLKKANAAPVLHYKVNIDFTVNSIIHFLDNRESGKSKKWTIDLPESGQSMDYLESGQSINRDYQRLQHRVDEADFSYPSNPLEAEKDIYLSLFKKVTDGVFPGASDWKTVIDCMAFFCKKHETENKTVEYLKPFWLRWASSKRKNGQPYAKTNINWLTDWAMSGEMPVLQGQQQYSRDKGLDNIKFYNGVGNEA